MQLHGRGLAAHGRDGGAHPHGRAERGVHAAVRVPAEPRGGQGRYQGAASPLPGKQHRGCRLRPGRVGGQPAQPHQAYDRGGEEQPGRQGSRGPRRPHGGSNPGGRRSRQARRTGNASLKLCEPHRRVERRHFWLYRRAERKLGPFKRARSATPSSPSSS